MRNEDLLARTRRTKKYPIARRTRAEVFWCLIHASDGLGVERNIGAILDRPNLVWVDQEHARHDRPIRKFDAHDRAILLELIERTVALDDAPWNGVLRRGHVLQFVS